MTIRNIKESDLSNVKALLDSFNVNSTFFDSLYSSSSYINELSFVLENEEKLIGLMIFSKNKLNKVTGLTLAPLLIEPEFQHKGLGKHLLKRGLNVAETLGYDYVIAIGNVKFYEKYNFKPLETYGVIGDENSLILSLNNDDEELNCEVKYPRAIKYLKIKIKMWNCG